MAEGVWVARSGGSAVGGEVFSWSKRRRVERRRPSYKSIKIYPYQ